MTAGIGYERLAAADLEGAKRLLEEYLAWVGVDLSFQNIGEELARFPHYYQEPDGVFLVAKDGREIVGCVGLRSLGAGLCEMKRLFVRDDHKGRGIGAALVGLIVEEARRKGYARMRLDTLAHMEKAQALYRRFGFYEIEQYVENPIEGTLYLERLL